MDEDNHDGHYNYFLTDGALAYQKEIQNNPEVNPIDKMLYMEHDDILMEYINEFYLESISK